MTRLYADGKCIAMFPDDDDYDPPAYISTRCKTCGAHMQSGQVKCHYCGNRRPIKNEEEYKKYERMGQSG